MKVCSICKTEKTFDSFNFKYRNRGVYQSCCKVCWNETNKKRYNENKQYYIDKAERYKKEQRDWYKELKKTLCCETCGFSHPAALQFHHLDPTKKEMTVSGAVALGWAKNRILKEIQECQVLCANCHFILHYEEKD